MPALEPVLRRVQAEIRSVAATSDVASKLDPRELADHEEAFERDTSKETLLAYASLVDAVRRLYDDDTDEEHDLAQSSEDCEDCF